MKQYSTFNQAVYDHLSQPMFFGENVNVARYDQQRHHTFEKLTENQLAFFWRPEEVDLTIDRKDFMGMPDHERHIFLSNLKYQILLDSVQGRSPNVALLPVVSLPELETWIETWSFSETIHSRSYTHIIRNILPDPSLVFDDIVVNEKIIERATSVTAMYDSFIYYVNSVQAGNTRFERKKAYRLLLRLLMSIYILEAIRFYVSFACSFAFAERALMEGNAKIIKLIARDEALHKQGTQYALNQIRFGNECPEATEAFNELMAEGVFDEMFNEAERQEIEWADYLFKDGSMIGLNAHILTQYVKFISDKRRMQVGIDPVNGTGKNPLPWMNGWLVSDNVQVAPQESEISSYLVGQIDNDLAEADFGSFNI